MLYICHCDCCLLWYIGNNDDGNDHIMIISSLHVTLFDVNTLNNIRTMTTIGTVTYY